MPIESARLLGVGHLGPNPAWRLATQRHHFHELIVVAAGRMGVESRGQRWPAEAGDILLYPAGVPHAEWSDPKQPVEIYFLGFDRLAVLEGTIVKKRDEAFRIREIIQWLYAERVMGSGMDGADQRYLLHAILARFWRAGGTSTPLPVQAVRRHIAAHLAQPLTLAALARVAGLSKFHFLRAYKRWTGRTPMEEVRRLRIEHARDLLLTTNLSIKEIAPRAGLGSEFSMSRAFRKSYGVPPAAWRHGGRPA